MSQPPSRAGGGRPAASASPASDAAAAMEVTPVGGSGASSGGAPKAAANGSAGGAGGGGEGGISPSTSVAPSLTPLGLAKGELTRLLIQELEALHFPIAARALEQESGVEAHCTALARLRAAVLDGRWADLLPPDGEVWTAIAPLFASEEAARDARFLVARQQFLELLEAGRRKEALACLRGQVRPAARAPADLHRLPLLYLCRSVAEVRERAAWAGAGLLSRHALLAALRPLLPAGALLPELRLETLLAREVLRQRSASLWPYVASPHSCFLEDAVFEADTLPTVPAAVVAPRAGELWYLSFSPSGARLATTAKNKAVSIWNVPAILARAAAIRGGGERLAAAPDEGDAPMIVDDADGVGGGNARADSAAAMEIAEGRGGGPAPAAATSRGAPSGVRGVPASTAAAPAGGGSAAATGAGGDVALADAAAAAAAVAAAVDALDANDGGAGAEEDEEEEEEDDSEDDSESGDEEEVEALERGRRGDRFAYDSPHRFTDDDSREEEFEDLMMLPGGGGGVFNGGPGGGGASNGGPGGGASVPSSSREPLGSADLADLASRLPVVTPDDDGVLEATLPHDDPASVVAWAPDEATLLTAGGDAVVRLWDVATGALVRSYVGHDGMVTAAAWLPSGTQFASGGMDGHVLVWDVATGALVHTLPHQERVSDVAVSANGRWVVASFADKMVRIYAATAVAAAPPLLTAAAAAREEAEASRRRAVASGAPGRAASAGAAGQAGGASSGGGSGGGSSTPAAAAGGGGAAVGGPSGGDGRGTGGAPAAAGGASGTAAGDGSGRGRGAAGRATVRLAGAAAAAPGAAAAAGAAPAPAARAGAAAGGAAPAASPPPSAAAAAATATGRTETATHTLRLNSNVTSISLSADGTTLLANTALQPGGSVQEWDIASGVLTRTFEGQQQSRYVIRSAFGGHRDGWVVSGSEDSTVLLWHRETTRLVGRLYGHSGSVNCAAWSPAHDALVASASDDGTLWLWTSKRAVDAAVGVGGVTPVPVTAFERAADLNPLGGGGRRGGGGDGGEGAAGGGRGGDATGTAGAQSQLVGLPTTATASAGSSRRAVGTSGRRRPLWGASRGYGASVADVMARARAAAGASVTSRFVLP